MKPIRVMSLFDGISMGRLALQRANIPVEKYYASEIDKYAIAITQYNYPDTIQLGDVTKVDFKKFEGKIDLLIGGSPCTSFSIAGKREEFEGESKLFYEYVRAIKECKPTYFFLENVESMSNEVKEIISKEMGCYPICINSSLVSGQNRRRYYWFNWGNKQYNLFGFPTCDILQPEDKGILLKDILESGLSYQEKSDCLTARYNGCLFPHDYFRHQRTQIAETIRIGEFCNGGQGERIYYAEGKSVCLGCGGSIRENYALPIRLSEYEQSSGQAQRVYSVRGKSVTLNANGGGQGGKTGLYKIDLPDGDYIIRKLTPVECERLQTMPDNFTKYGMNEKRETIEISNSQRYKCIGNSWTCDVIAYIFSFLKQELDKTTT